MAVYEVKYFIADCDNCPWISLEQTHEHEAQAILLRHITTWHKEK